MTTLVQGPSKATLFETKNEALMAGEEFCHNENETHGRTCVEAAKIERGWVAVVLPEGQDFDTFLRVV